MRIKIDLLLKIINKEIFYILLGLVLPFVNLEKFEEKNELLLSCSNIEAGFGGFSNNDSKLN